LSGIGEKAGKIKKQFHVGKYRSFSQIPGIYAQKMQRREKASSLQPQAIPNKQPE
jgi:hypothetical protein